MSARRAAVAVAFKNARRNKKRTFYLVALIGLPVLVAVMTSAVVRASYLSPAEQAASEYGAANVRVDWVPAPGVDEWVRDALAEVDPGAEVLEYRIDYKTFGTRLFGQVTDVDLEDPLADGMLTVTAGRAPVDIGEVVLTEHLALALAIDIGDTTTFLWRGREQASYEVVGLASHPVLWSHDQAVVAPEEMDLIDTARQLGHLLIVRTDDDSALAADMNRRWEEVRHDFYPEGVEWPMPEELYFLSEEYYAQMTEEELADTRSILEEEGEEAASNFAYGLFPNGVSVMLPQVYTESLTDRLSWQQVNLAESPPVIGTAVAAVILAEVAFIAGAAFATGTRRRLREIGLLGANGADTSHVKTSVVGEGFVAGLGGGALGAGLAVLLLALGRGTFQRFVPRRLDGFPLSALDVVGPIVVAVVACVIAAWLPARTASGVPTLTALQGRMPVGRPKRWVIPVGLAVTGFGTLLLAVGLGTASTSGGAVATIGAVLMIGGAALLAGPVVAWVSKHAERFPITSRIVLRDSGRQRGRAAAAVAATMVILMAPVAGLAALASSEANLGIYGLPEESQQMLVEGRFDEEYNYVPLSEADLLELESLLPSASMATFDALDVRVEYPAELAARKVGDTDNDGGYEIGGFRVAVANDELLAALGDDRLRRRLTEDGMVLIGVEERTTTIAIDGRETTVAEVPVPVQRYSFPRLLVTEKVAAELGGDTRVTALLEVDPGWLANPFGSPFDALWEQGVGEFVTSGGASDTAAPLLYALGFLATMLIVLIVVATITALSAAEADNDLRTVVAVGATNSIRRRYLGLQSGLHTLIGAWLAVPLTLLLYKTAVSASGGYQSVGNFDVWQSSTMYIPWLGLALLAFGLPVMIGLVTAATVRSAPTTPPVRAT